ncbi:hypothetical protein A0H81_06834 [Grifola frondosa]|uniref:Uncharacterized protein n=1 Tax=Grifola frondosa TaxID=5627 RepID=A0A1C7M8X1_GRIFR|nr:hypothetical protein A0H81_06834 [Grifola frondosa]
MSARLEIVFLSVAIILLALNTTSKVAIFVVWLQGRTSEHTADAIWMVERPPVLFEFDSYSHYQAQSAAEWSALVPGDGIVYLGPHHQPFIVAMFHQLRCLDIVRNQLATPVELRELETARHCINYLREMILCRGDTFLDPYQYAHKIAALDPHPIRRCLDWRAVYTAVEVNQEAYADSSGIVRDMEHDEADR